MFSYCKLTLVGVLQNHPVDRFKTLNNFMNALNSFFCMMYGCRCQIASTTLHGLWVSAEGFKMPAIN